MEHRNHSDPSDLIVTCAHVVDRGHNLQKHFPKSRFPKILSADMVYVENGRVLIAVCLACAKEQCERHAKGITEPLPGFTAICPEHALEAGIPSHMKQPDGFYEYNGADGEWVRQLDDSESTVN